MLKTVSAIATQIISSITGGLVQFTGPAAGTTRIITVPNANATMARTDAAQSFTGDQTLGTGNLIQGTAGKGFNFTANTSLAGMTSRLLNWYEEGAWTPTVTSSSGTITSYTVNSARYTRIGRQVSVIMDIKITNAGTGAGLFIATLPFTNGSQLTSGSGIEYFNSVVTLQGYVAASGTSVSIVKYDNSGIIATNSQVLFSLTYFV